jgi:hypothetical protein
MSFPPPPPPPIIKYSIGKENMVPFLDSFGVIVKDDVPTEV